MTYTLPKLNYAYNALEPWIDAKTMEIHYTKHHQGYVTKLNGVLEKYPDLADRKLPDLMQNLTTLKMDEADRVTLRNNGGGHLNHTLFWSVMGKEKTPDQALEESITKKYKSLDDFKKIFSQTAMSRFGSGWAWLVKKSNGELDVYSTANQDSPYLNGDTPLFGLDVWEHAYYLKYQNRRAEYIEAWWNVLKLI